MRIVSVKKRSQKEIDGIIEDFKNNLGLHEISSKYEVSEQTIYRILQKHHGSFSEVEVKKTRLQRLEKKLSEQEKEISLLRAALKKL